MPSPTSAPRLTLWVATTNRGKTREFKLLLSKRWRIHDLHALPKLPPIRETGATFLANAKIKALAVSRRLPGKLILSDDSGLVVPALGGRPGVRSARFSGPKATNESNRAKLLKLMTRLRGSLRRAYFQAVLVLARDGRVIGSTSGRVWGRITAIEQGMGGFGYDPIFQPRGFSKTFGELNSSIKNRISHRARACRMIQPLMSRAERS